MDRRITLQALTTTSDGGFLDEDWNDVATVWADVRETAGREVAEFDREVNYREARFFIRYRSDITEEHRIQYDGEEWDLQYVRELGRQEGTEIFAVVAK